jgi:hypothetical protein
MVLATVKESITVGGTAPAVDTSTNTLGKVVSGREVLDLPLNGRNFAQLGLLQAGVAPLSAGLATEGALSVQDSRMPLMVSDLKATTFYWTACRM